MGIRIGDQAPNFEMTTTEGTLNFYDWAADSWVMLFSHPKDFTPVCTTELGEVAKLQKEWESRNVQCLAISIDTVDDHSKWIGDINTTQSCSVYYPIIGDPDKKISALYDMIHPNENSDLTIRSVYIIGPDRKVRLVLNYPISLGRNFNEVLRCVDGIQTAEKYDVATPVNWSQGQDVIIPPDVKDDEIEGKYGKGHKTVTPYLRTTTIR